MDITEHTKKVTERLKVISSNEASITVDGDNVVYTSWNNSFWIEIPREDKSEPEENI